MSTPGERWAEQRRQYYADQEAEFQAAIAESNRRESERRRQQAEDHRRAVAARFPVTPQEERATIESIQRELS